MNLRNRIANVFKQHEPVKDLPTNEVAWSDLSMIYTSRDFERYNPDDLIGAKGFAIYKKMMRDEQVKAVVKFKRDAITSRDYIFELDYERFGITEGEAEKRIDLSYTVIEKIEGSWIDSLNGIFSASQNGYSMSEKVFGQIEYDNRSWWGIDKLKLKPYDTFSFNSDEYGNMDSVIQKVNGKEQKIDIKKFVHFVINPDIDEHYGESELRAAYRAWFSKDNIIKFRNMWLERHAGGFRYATPKDGTKLNSMSQEYETLKSVMSNIQTATGIILPSGYEMKGEYPANNVAFKEAIDDYNIDISRALLVPNLLGITPSGQTGSFSQSNTQLEAFFWTLEADSKRAEEVINEQIFRQLAEVNFGDDAWPRFKFNPISETKKNELVNTWKDLVTGGAVTRTKTDEAHIRSLLDFPEADETDLVNPGDRRNDDSNNDSNSNSDSDNVDTDPTVDITGNADNSDSNMDNANNGGNNVGDDETIVGKGLVSISAFSKAQRRVDFAVIAKSSDSVVDEFTIATADVMDLIFEDLIFKAKSGGSLDTKVKDNLKEVKLDNGLKRKLNKIQTAMLKESYSVGKKHSAFEIDKAKKSDFSRYANSERLKFIADDYFKMKSFKITGNFSAAAIALIQAEILNGTKYDKTWAQVEKAIYTTAATEGLISIEQAKEALGEALGVANPDARIRTVIRTSSWDAINEARHAYFTDPQLDGYVIAYEYSSILDDRITQICKHLDEENRGDHSLEWYAENPQYRPPNHYNCRSLLIPVTTDDEDSYVEGKDPTMQPQKGFK